MTRQIELIDERLARGADINARRADGARPIHLTNGDYSFRGWRDVPQDLPVRPAEVLAHLRTRGAYCDLCTAASVGDLERVRALVQEDAALANRVLDCRTGYLGSGSPLRNAAARGHLETVKLLLEHGADPNLAEEGVAPYGHALYARGRRRPFRGGGPAAREGRPSVWRGRELGRLPDAGDHERGPADDRVAGFLRGGAFGRDPRLLRRCANGRRRLQGESGAGGRSGGPGRRSSARPAWWSCC